MFPHSFFAAAFFAWRYFPPAPAASGRKFAANAEGTGRKFSTSGDGG